jgi:hypothetical protein
MPACTMSTAAQRAASALTSGGSSVCIEALFCSSPVGDRLRAEGRPEALLQLTGHSS